MPKEYGRNLRIAETIQRIAAPLVAGLAREHRWGMVTITDVEVASDKTVARLFVSVMGHPDPAAVLAGLREALPDIRSAVARDLPMKKVPALQVAEDKSIAHGARIAELLKSEPAGQA